MDIKAYIESGILELYVAGALSEKESQEIYVLMKKHPEILLEVQKIETAIIKLTSEVAPKNTEISFDLIKRTLYSNNDSKVVSLTDTRTNWFSYIGWAASIVFAAGLLWTINQNNTLKTKIITTESDKEFLEFQIEKTNNSLKEAKTLISVLRARDIISVPLDGQAIYPDAFAQVYWDKNSNNIYLDVQGLPKPPVGKVYQVWSLTLNPLTPTSLGILDDFNTNENKIFTIENTNASQAFGITLEPAGGSKSPSLEQLYTLGIVGNVS